MADYKVVLEGGSPWGFRLKGGRGSASSVPLVISKINPGSKAAYAHISVGDKVEEINGRSTEDLDQNDAQNLIRSAETSLELILTKPLSVNGPLNNNNNSNMSAQTTSSIAGQQSVSNFTVDDETVSVDGVTFHGFSPSNVSVTRTTTTKVTKTTRSRSPSPSRGRSNSSENLTIYPIKQMTVHYDSEPESDVPVKFMSGVKWMPPGSKVNAPLSDENVCTCKQPSHSPSIPNTNSGHVTHANEYSQLSARPPRPRDRNWVAQSHRHRSSLYVRPRSRSTDASRKTASPWKPVTFQPRSKDDTAKYAFSSPPVPPPPPESDTEDIPPVIPPKPKVVKRKLYLSANQPQAPPEIYLNPPAKCREHKTSRGAEMFLKRQAQQGITKVSDSPEEPPPPWKTTTNDNQYPVSPTSPEGGYTYTQSLSSYHQPCQPEPGPTSGYIVDSTGESWPAPPSPIASSTEDQPRHSDTNPARSQSNPAGHPSGNPSCCPVENKTPAAWNPVSSNQPKGFKPIKLDLNPKPKPWRSFESTSQPEKGNVQKAPSVVSSQQSTWQPPPVSSGPVPNGDVHSPHRPFESQHSPYRPGDPHQDQERYNPGYQHQDRSETRPAQSPQDFHRLEFRPVPEGYSTSLPRSVSPTVTLLQYQREREKEHRSHADYLPPDNSLMPPSLMPKAPSVEAKQPAPIVTKSLHAGTFASIISDPNDLPEGAVFQKQTVDGNVIHTDTYYPVKTREVTKKMIHKDAPQYEGIGPKDETGLPIGLRSHVKEENRHDWYKEMFKTIHKQDRPEDEIDQTYMDALLQEANMYEPSYSFPGAVNVKDDGDSVFEDDPPSVKIYPAARADQWSHDPTLDVSPPSSPRHHSPNTSAHNTIERYRQQPRSIIDYEPGKSSLAERDKSPTAQLYNPPVEPITAVQNTKKSTTLPRDFVQIRQVPAESPSSRLGPPRQEEPIRSSSRPLSSTLPRAKTKSQSGPLESSGLSAAERLGIKSSPPQRTPSTGSKPSRHSSGSDKIYNYRDPPPTVDKAKAEKLIEEERRRKERLQLEEQKYKRHSDYTPIKSPIITNERFRDPVISAKDDGRKQEVKACAIALYPFKAQTHKELSFAKGDIIYLLRKIDKNWFEGEHHGNAGIFPSSYVEVVTSLEDAKKAQQHGPGLEGKGRAKYKFTGETPMELSFNKGEYVGLTKKIDANWWEGCIGDRKGIFPAAYIEVLREPTGVASPSSAKSPPAASQTSYHPSSQQMVQSSPKQQYRQQAAPSSLDGRLFQGPPKSLRSYGSNLRDPDPYFEQPVPKPSRTLAAAQDLYVASYAYMPQNEDEIELQEGDLVNVLEKCDDGWYVGMSERTGMFGTFPGNYVYKHVHET